MLSTFTAPAARVLARIANDGMLCSDDAVFTGTWEAVDPVLPPGSPLVESGHAAVVRFARPVAVPRQLPALHFLAIRVPDHDLLLTSVGRGPVGSRVPLPVRTVRGTTYSTLVPRAVEGATAPLVAEVHGPGPATVPELGRADACMLEVQLFLGTGGMVGRIRLGRRLDEQATGSGAVRPTGKPG